MMPHLGVLSTVHEKSATEVFNKDCLILLGSCIAPLGVGKEGQKALTIKLECKDKKTEDLVVNFGEIKLLPLDQGEEAKATLQPGKGFDVGEGRGKPLAATVFGGIVGLVIDCRGRPFNLPENKGKRMEKLNEWFTAMNLYPET